MSTRTGACLCGAVTYSISADPAAVRICWCKSCQKISANGTVNVLVQSDTLQYSGELAEFVSTADSGNQVTRKFCPKCGVQLFSNSSGRPQFTVVRAGTLADPSSVRPTMNIWAASAPAWACLDPALDVAQTQPGPPPQK
ncbi:MAG: GFA family protein [Rhodocyclaceae bacterium]|nr:GFA family protein [Rhodocyclaceae bacterium]